MVTFAKYALVNDLVVKLTANKSLQTFFTLYLMAETLQERQQLSQKFEQATSSLEGDDLAALKHDFTNSFQKLLPLAKDLNRRTAELAESKWLFKQAA